MCDLELPWFPTGTRIASIKASNGYDLLPFYMRRGSLFMVVLQLYIYHDSPEFLLFTLIGYNNHKYAAVYPYYL